MLNNNKCALLHSTRHFGSLAYYAVLNNKTRVLLDFFALNKE